VLLHVFGLLRRFVRDERWRDEKWRHRIGQARMLLLWWRFMQHEDEGHVDERHERHEEQTPVMKGFAPSCFLQPGAALFRAAPNQTMIPVRSTRCAYSVKNLSD